MHTLLLSIRTSYPQTLVIRFFRHQFLPSRPVQLIVRTVQEWQRDQCLEMGAALAYYALFSIFPIFLVMLSILGFVLGKDTNLINDILLYAQGLLPEVAFQVFEDVLFDLNSSSVGAGITGFLLLFVSASNVFGALSRSVDKIWNVHHKRQEDKTLRRTAFMFLQDKMLAFTMVLSSALVMMLSLLTELIVDIVRRLLQEFNSLVTVIKLDEVMIISQVQGLVSFLLLNIIVMILFKVLPATRVTLSEVWPGALLTTSFLTLLQYLVSNSIIHVGAQYRSYGIIGGVMVLLLWLYLICQVFFLGSEFTYVYSHLYGSRRNQLEPELSP
jgi:membrane protein